MNNFELERSNSPNLKFEKIYRDMNDKDDDLEAMDIRVSVAKANYRQYSNHISFDFIPLLPKELANYWRIWSKWIVFLIFIVSVIVVLSKTSGNEENGIILPSIGVAAYSYDSSSIRVPKNIRQLLKSATIAGRKSGQLITAKTRSAVPIKCDNFEFVVLPVQPSDIPHSKTYDDPLAIANIAPELLISQLSSYHTLALNKYNVIPDHAMLITNEFEEQSHGLIPRDFETWYSVIDTVGALGFYNSDRISGASQRHKHMQLIPIDEIYKIQTSGGRDDVVNPIPLDSAILAAKEANYWKTMTTTMLKSSIYKLPQFKFKHSIALLLSPGEFKTTGQILTYGDYLYEVYRQLLKSLSIDCQTSNESIDSCALTSNNVLMTSQWMFVVKRKISSVPMDFVKLNGMSYSGIILASDNADLVRKTGPMRLLDNVSELPN